MLLNFKDFFQVFFFLLNIYQHQSGQNKCTLLGQMLNDDYVDSRLIFLLLSTFTTVQVGCKFAPSSYFSDGFTCRV